ncbi:MAG TPA: hypothetical protein VF592_05770 [Sphingomonas sp.]|jgi:hypothetical protein|uniref:hypothetical protein n=1 Tax=Sphingomonas sp. TaxID=28214 RepID=UPI002ED95AD4
MTITADDVIVEVDTSSLDAALGVIEGALRGECRVVHSVEPEAEPADPLVRYMREVQSRPPRRTDIRVPFGDGVYRFALSGKEVAELERRCGWTDKDGHAHPLGVGAIFGRMARGRAFLPTGEPDWSNIGELEVLASEIVERDVVETVRLALIGGAAGEVDGEAVKVTPNRARELVDLYVIGQPLEEAWTLAFAILGARICGRTPDPETGA